MIGRRSLRAQLSMLVAVLVLLACAAVGVASTLELRGFLLQRLDQQLDAAGDRYALALEHPAENDHDADNAATDTVGQSVGTLGARVLNGTVTESGLIAGTGSARQISQSDKDILARLTVGKHSADLPGLGEYRLLVSNGRDGDLLITGLSEHGVHDTLGHVMVTEAIAFAVVVLAGVGLLVVLMPWILRSLVEFTTAVVQKIPQMVQ